MTTLLELVRAISEVTDDETRGRGDRAAHAGERTGATVRELPGLERRGLPLGRDLRASQGFASPHVGGLESASLPACAPAARVEHIVPTPHRATAARWASRPARSEAQPSGGRTGVRGVRDGGAGDACPAARAGRAPRREPRMPRPRGARRRVGRGTRAKRGQASARRARTRAPRSRRRDAAQPRRAHRAAASAPSANAPPPSSSRRSSATSRSRSSSPRTATCSASTTRRRRSSRR